MGKLEENWGFCPSCQRGVVIRRKGPNHLVHLILSLLTSGLWVIIWLAVSVKPGGWKCAECATPAKVN
jgi:hypothetical protein